MAGQPPTYSITDRDIIRMMLDRTLEPRNAVDGSGNPVPTTTMWTSGDLISYIDYRQKEYIKLTGIVVTRLGYDGDTDNSIPVTPNQSIVPNLPQNMIDILRLAWVNYDTSTPVQVENVTEAPREDSWSLDHTETHWEVDMQRVPSGYTETLSEPLQLMLSHPPDDIGSIDLTFIAFSSALSNTGVKLSVPDEVSPYIVWGALADCFSKPGESYDPDRAAYCESRWDEGVALGKSLLFMPAKVASMGAG